MRAEKAHIFYRNDLMTSSVLRNIFSLTLLLSEIIALAALINDSRSVFPAETVGIVWRLRKLQSLQLSARFSRALLPLGMMWSTCHWS